MSSTRPYKTGDHGAEPPAPPSAAAGDATPHREPSPQRPSPTSQPSPSAVPGEPAHQIRRLRLCGVIGAVARAREFTRRALHDWGWLPAAAAEQRAAAEDALLVVCELVTNACLHAGGPDELRVHHAGKLLRVEVTDRGTGAPKLRTSRRPGQPGGHGMFIVQRLCLEWGVTQGAPAGGKTVWAELSSPGLNG